MFGSNQVPIIAGPNTVENKDMMFRCCEALEKKKIKLLRAGLYKPLTFPYRSDKYFELGVHRGGSPSKSSRLVLRYHYRRKI